tara:strand:- start:23121 stop:23948 length:828 start_codon:yes stop_codon:yes gene_type:complete
MKKLIITPVTVVLISLLISFNAEAQDFYASISAGYNTSFGTSNLTAFDFYNYKEVGTKITEEQVNISLGKGLSINGLVGYSFNKHIGAELGFSYLIGGETTANDQYDNESVEYTFSSNMLRIIPTLVVSSGLKDIDPYAKFGLIMGSGSVTYGVSSDFDGNIAVNTIKMDGGIAFGLNAAIGANYELKENLLLFLEINTINMSYAPTRGELIEATFNGVDELSDYTTSEKEVEFVDSYTFDFAGPFPPESEPSKALKQRLPFSSIGINLGLRVNF